MDSPINLNLRKSKLQRHPPPGSVPGTFFIAEDALPPQITVYSYNIQSYVEERISDLSSLKKHFQENQGMQHWVDVKGIGNQELLEGLAQMFNIHKLVLADVVNVYQRPKMEEHKDHLFIVSRMIYENSDEELFNEQVSVFLGHDFVLSIQERYDNTLAPVRERLITGKGFLRSLNADYLAYAIIDAVLDNYFPLLEQLGDYLDGLEQRVITGQPAKELLYQIQAVKRELIVIRRTAWQSRDMINDLLRTNTPFISDNTKLFLRDAYDHNMQVIDVADSFREVTSSLLEIYLSSTNARMNQIMKVLAIISTLFIPLTFIVGIYGMNFSYSDPRTGEIFYMNMPELYSPYGYIGVCVVMAIIFFGSLMYFKSKGWLGKD